MNAKKLERFHRFIKERHAIYVAKEAGKPKPWTDDPILQQYRFCNVFRELDVTTKWIKENWRDPNVGDDDLIFAMAVARFFNRTSTLEVIRYPVPWRPRNVEARIMAWRDAGHKVFTGAYLISSGGGGGDKVLYVINDVLTPLWQNREYIRPTNEDTLDSVANRLCEFTGIKSFMAGQIVCDTKHAVGSPLATAPDWWDWSIPGPGSRRGMNRLLGRDLYERISWPQWQKHMKELSSATRGLLGRGDLRLHAQDIQNCLCEFDKYERTRLGEGRPRSTYPGEG